MNKERLDLLLVCRGLAPSREKASALVLAGLVRIDGQVAPKPGALVPADSSVSVQEGPKYASRGGLKLEHALDVFAVPVAGRVALDVGASTGGFTDVLLRRGAERVYAVDVGYGQLDWRLRKDPRVVVMDRTNIRYLTSLPEHPDVATVDTSFISLKLVLPSVSALVKPGADVIVLIKPQFEAGRGDVGKGGVVRDPQVHARVLQHLAAWFESNQMPVVGTVPSPVRGAKGNVEYLAHLKLGGAPIP